MSRKHYIVLIAAFVSTVLPLSQALAASSQTQVKPGNQQIVNLEGSTFKGKQIMCRYSGAKILIGYRLQKKAKVFFNDPVKQLKLKANASSGKTKAALLKKAKKLNKTLSDQFKPGCQILRDGPPVTPTPVGPPVSGAECESMDQYAGAFGENEARYLLEKFGFGVGVAEEERLMPSARAGDLAGFAAAAFSYSPEAQGTLDTVDGLAAQDPAGGSARQAILLHNILTRNAPLMRLSESLHGIITTGRDVLSANQQQLWYDHWKNVIRRAVFEGRTFIQMVQDSAKSPMMLRWLDNYQNYKNRPNENYARELQELFTLGAKCPGADANYSETRPEGDVINAARILTGYSINAQNQQIFVPAQHDTTPYIMYAGTPYQFAVDNMDDLITGILTRHPCAGKFYAQELLKDFVTEEPSQALIDNFAAVIRANNFNIDASMAALMKSKAGLCQAYHDSTTKKPDRMTAELVRTMKLREAVTADMQNTIPDLISGVEASGFMIDAPPTVFYYKPQVFRTPSQQLELMGIVGRLHELAKNTAGFSVQSICPTGTATSEDVVSFIAKALNLNLTDAQRAVVVNYLDTSYNNNGQGTRSVYVNTPSVQQVKCLGAWFILSMHPSVPLG